ncbi:ankyrin repeat-containing protein ITN1-like isoform X2 [Rhododendron vialii]|uniref:ankyrin repeat-containing protein ITN1-like isoform X2 n=1 Tax=Rhododendron vialii TaxID=182163 RepID=UPI00265F44D7|nr:ankyrin repeat-containing protein ITN1-like isoform X2 [Rhododendron vialii]XP_058191695.1 ankyrin repeat-containing protein ITN1-like isoform X2 [Rhododendron vialii]
MASSSNTQENAAATSRSTQPVTDQSWRYIPLVKAVLGGNWERAKRFFDQDQGALTAWVTEFRETALHIAVGTGKEIQFVEKLVELMPVEALALTDNQGQTALHAAARVGNTKAAEVLVQKHPPLLYIRQNVGWLPIHQAAVNAQRETLAYLLTVTKDDPVSLPFSNDSGLDLIIFVISSNFYDIAFNLVDRYPHLATLWSGNSSAFSSALARIAKTESAFLSGSSLNFWQRMIYSYVPVKLEKCSKEHNIGDVESPPINISQATQVHKDNRAQSFGEDNSTSGRTVSQKLQAMLWKVLELSVPQIKHIRERKLVHLQALQLVNSLCEKIKSLNDIDAYHTIAKTAIMIAAKTGIPEVVEEIAEWFPSLIWKRDSENRNVFHQAIIYRHENIFNLIYQMSDHKYFATNFLDKFGDSMLHVAGQLAPPNKLNLVPGAALQMQRELQWLKEVEKFLYPGYREMKNAKEETPAMVFTREHKDLVVAGEKWMKDTANSCTIAAALIATVVFAAAITVPGGNNGDNGLPIFSKRKAFIVFAVSDALSLFTSATSLLMFLSILTSRYAEGDFLYALPKRLIIGLVTLFLSITAMMVAFSFTLYLVFGQKKAWTLIPGATLACLPVTSFVSLQFPLLVDVISSTYGPGIFGKQSNRPFY